jgi:hypothetical protein
MELPEALHIRQEIEAATHQEMRGTNLSDFQPHTITTDSEILHLSSDHRRENTAVARMRPERSAGVAYGGRVVARIGVANM